MRSMIKFFRERLYVDAIEAAVVSRGIKSGLSIRDSSMQNSRVRNMMLRRREHAFVQESGFTLMELLIVLALIATISMIAIPLYSNYLQRAKITEGLTLAKGIQLEAELYYALNGDWPRENAHQALGLDKASDYRGNSVESIALEGNEITITYNDEVGAEGGPARLILRAEAPGGTIRWRCSGENIAEDHLPKECLP
ncbi:hypothetical protein DC081_06085 [Ignatzschineria cameli]|uniref:Prepilin-type cleavage/methylation domain-containing protein n=2 Tax=Ignatzschineria cameli TaxID=2182793 RepID=A0A2U2AQ16_9GAMM|nr:hypothetical protein DC080_09235 [Ignatzschineria cameli]PWD85730.1 hypothetical protein DC077_06750 [Ignatzschineria cameli]PWD89359.1 hypothetical protein DC079_06375 [Ignatzschineria cameli]PWD90831.1 hypothetical protein DC081_06085 [Ignatzschineria cameli]PWD91619.1 hypothetical protein DC078_06370 [Ignatzschineria cameli]